MAGGRLKETTGKTTPSNPPKLSETHPNSSDAAARRIMIAERRMVSGRAQRSSRSCKDRVEKQKNAKKKKEKRVEGLFIKS